MIKYSTISLPKELYDKLQKFIEEKPEMGYSSVADFCKEAIRLHVEEIKRELREDFIRKLDIPYILKKIEKFSTIDAGIYGEAFEKLSDMAFLLSKDFKIKDCNAEFVSKLGYLNKEEVIGRSIEDFFENVKIKENIKGFQDFKDFETKAKMRNGKKIDVLLSIKKLSGKIKYVGIAKDISVRKYVEEKERKKRELYEHLINELCDTIIVAQDGKIKFVNKEVTRGGYSEKEVIGKSIDKFIAEEDRKRLLDMYKKVINGKAESKPRRYKIICKDGKIREVEILSRKIEFDGRPAVLATLRFLEF